MTGVPIKCRALGACCAASGSPAEMTSAVGIKYLCFIQCLVRLFSKVTTQDLRPRRPRFHFLSPVTSDSTTIRVIIRKTRARARVGPSVPVLSFQRDELNLSRRCLQLQCRAAAVQVAFRVHLAWAVVSAFRLNTDSGQIAADGIASGGHVDAGMNADLQVRRKIHDDVTNAGIEHRVAEFAVHGHELSGNAAGAGLGTHAASDLEAMDAAAAGLRTDCAFAAAGETNAASTGFDIHGASYVANINVPSTRRSAQIATDVLHVDVPAAGFNHGVALDVVHTNRFAAGRGVQLAADGADIHAAASGTDSQIGIHGTHIDCAATGACGHVAVNVVEIDGASAGFGLHASIQVRKAQIAAIGFGLNEFDIPRRDDVELHRASMPIVATLTAEIGRISRAAGDHPQVLEHAPRVLFRGGAHALANRVGDVGLLRAGYADAAGVGVNLDVARGGQSACGLLHPATAVTIDFRCAFRLAYAGSGERQ